MSQLSLRLEHRVVKALKREALPPRWLLAVSGGLDSMVLAEILYRWRRYLGVELAIGHIHHGLANTPQDAYRAKAQAQVRAWAKAHRLRFYTLKARPRALNSEAELRALRHGTLERWRRHYGYDLTVLAHHRDDLLETRLLRLIRGSGAQGLTAMRLRAPTILRPLLSVTREELELYARERQLEWCEDPSNGTHGPLRNWLRQEWLPKLESKQKGALKALSRSLEILSPDIGDTQLGQYVGLRRKDIQRVSFTRQQAVVAEYLRALGIQGYGRAHVEEILKRLDTNRREFHFDMLGFRFRVTPDLLWASRV
ncbi:MAG: tRNA lysidine(34) synthetase TilS [Bdellovibrionales bacterium]|nr:tRNA lysidine(34) synthetase TilS [Bdellovibrionales bacterium]